MKKLMFVGLVIFLSSSIYGQTLEFYTEAISHLKCGAGHCYFIPLNIESDSFSGKIVVENSDLFDYLKRTNELDEQAYVSFMLRLFQNNQPLKLDGVTVDQSGNFLTGSNLKQNSFRIVEISQEFETVSLDGCENIMRYYFSPIIEESKLTKTSSCKEAIKLNAEDLLIRPRFDINEQNNVILKLFEQDIPIYLDDISGSLKIGYLTLK